MLLLLRVWRKGGRGSLSARPCLLNPACYPPPPPLHLLQASKPMGTSWEGWAAPPIPRGDLLTTFVFKGFDEVRRLGLQQSTEREVRLSPACSHGTAPGERLRWGHDFPLLLSPGF